MVEQVKGHGASFHYPCYFLCILCYFKIKQASKVQEMSGAEAQLVGTQSLGFSPQDFTVWWCTP